MELSIPEKIRIGPIEYDVQMCNEKEIEHVGTHTPYYSQIRLDGSVNHDLAQTVFLHEIIEAINHHHELKMEHSQMSSLGFALAQVIKDLPEGE
jgi:hypothetical protein